MAHTITSMITEQNAHCLLGDLYGRMDATNQNGLHGLLLVVEMVVRDRPKLLKCIGCVEGEECSLETYLLAQHLCKKELTSRFVANLWICLLKFSEKCNISAHLEFFRYMYVIIYTKHNNIIIYPT